MRCVVAWKYSRVSPDVQFFLGAKIHYLGNVNGINGLTRRLLVKVSERGELVETIADCVIGQITSGLVHFLVKDIESDVE